MAENDLYLYGAAVQGIQGFIFQTNKLREIVGASELVEKICTELFVCTLYPDSEDPLKELEKDKNAVQNAAGNIKYIFTDEAKCKDIVRNFPKIVMEFAPGITISQSVVKYREGGFAEAVQQLERNLRVQRNKPMRDVNIGLMGIRRSRQTSLPATYIEKKSSEAEYIDAGTYQKLYDSEGKKRTSLVLGQKIFGENVNSERLASEMQDLTSGNDWIAIIHADGNGLGRVVQQIGTSKEKFRDFSRKLNEATVTAARNAFDEIIGTGGDSKIPMRPIVLGGDDLTVICRGDLAIPFTEAFIENFEKETKELLGGILGSVFGADSNYLTACAGIAFVKSSFPFHYGYKLAESLCDRAKKDTKKLYNAESGNLPASCLMFHKVQDSFISNFEEISVRELSPQANISFEFGPYYLKEVKLPGVKRWTIKELKERAAQLDSEIGNTVKSHLRNWMTLLYDDEDMARQKLERVKTINKMKEDVIAMTDEALRKESRERNGEEIEITLYPVYDLLALHTVNTQRTK
ncbi:MAG: hypothetical protein K2H47_09645 [Muribaculaceae bacterium]|nr:hypothetical protein [Muribaculaceae bacterium]